MFWAIFGLVFFASMAMFVREGLWSNAISLINILISGLVAFAFYGPLAIYFDEMLAGEYTYVLDFVTIWVLFTVTMLVCRSLTGVLSKTRMRFKHPIDPVGGPLVGLIAAWALTAFVLATLHTSPMPKEAFGGGLVHSDADISSTSSITAPDLAWLRFVERCTRPDAFGSANRPSFSASAFVKVYAIHRTEFSKQSGIRVRRG